MDIHLGCKVKMKDARKSFEQAHKKNTLPKSEKVLGPARAPFKIGRGAYMKWTFPVSIS